MTDETQAATDEAAVDQVSEAENTAEEQVSQEAETENTGEQAEQKSESEQSEEEKKQANEKTRRRRAQRRRQRQLEQEREARLEAEKQAAYYRGLAESGKAQPQGNDGEPQIDDFDNYDDFVRALTKYELGKIQKDEPAKAEPKEKPAEQSAPAIEPETVEKFNTAGFEKYGDEFQEMWEAAENGDFAASEIMAAAMFESDVGPELAMHFYDNPRDAERIAALPPYKQFREIQGLEDKLSKKAPPAKKVSQAPAPVNTETGDASPGVNRAKLSTEEYIALRRKERGLA